MPYDTQPLLPWNETVTYTVAGSGATSSITAARYLAGEEEGVGSYGVYAVRREQFTFSTDAVTAPKLRDTITPSGLSPRVITRIDGSPWLKFWDVEAAYPSLADALDQTATVYRANPVPDTYGLRDPHPVAVYEDAPCRLQPDKRTRNLDSAGRVATEQSFVCVFGSAVTLDAGDTVTVDGVVYEVTEQSEIEALGLLTFAAVTRVD